ncbi:MAG: aldo/keto reductase [Phycisphaerales bacterium]|nr:MAG: aldo/keto reductase [Phycisphaerales bacterium]
MEQTLSRRDRRSFLRTVGAVGLGSALLPARVFGVAKEDAASESKKPERPADSGKPKMPLRKLGKTGVKVPVLSLGTMFNLLDNQIILRRSMDLGVTYWDTSNVYAGGNSELGIGKYLTDNPKARKDLFIVTKALNAKDGEAMEKCLQLSLARMKTTYIDLHFFHDLRDPADLSDDIRMWAQGAKKRKLIRFFGFSTHKNMALCLRAAAKLDWIDAIMTVYNFRLMQDAEMQAGVDACHKAKIGLVAMKTQGIGPVAKWAGHTPKIETDADRKLVDHFLKRGLTEGQAKIKVVLDDKRFASVCVGMENVGFLRSNVDAVTDKPKLTRRDVDALRRYAEHTRTGYCGGCGHICESALPEAPCVSDIMRSLMYCNGYGRRDLGAELFASVPACVRSRLLEIDYSLSEARCPNRLPIQRLVAEAVREFA